MDWFFAFDESASTWFNDMVKVAVLSASKNTTLTAHCLYDGAANDLTEWLSKNGVIIHNTTVPFKDRLFSAEVIGANSGTPYSPHHACGAFLRLTAHTFTSGEVFLYTDCDVMFLDDRITDYEQLCLTLRAVPEIDLAGRRSFNSGVLLINREYFRSQYDSLLSLAEASNFYARQYHSYDQVFLNMHFAGQWTDLPPEMNWRPFQGQNEHASIIHFHGPKPHRIRAILEGNAVEEETSQMEDLIRSDQVAYTTYLAKFNEFLSTA